MLYKLTLKNTTKKLIIDQDVYEALKNNEYFTSLKVLDNLRIHSYGYAFFQKNIPKKDGKYKNITIYIHRFVAENYVPKPKIKKRLLVTFKNGNRLDCRKENIVWATSSQIIRNIPNTPSNNSSTGYRGVAEVNGKYRAAIFKGKERFDLGTFETAEEAAYAYNQKSIEWFGVTKSLNKLPKGFKPGKKKKGKTVKS